MGKARHIFISFISMTIFASPVMAAKAVKVIEPLSTSLVGKSKASSVTVSLNEATRENFAKLEQKAAEKRKMAGLAVFEKSMANASRPSPEQYSTLPIEAMMPLVIEDTLNEWGLRSGRGVAISVVLDTLKTADGGMMLLIGSTDQLAGTVKISDPENNEALGEFYVDVLNARGGWLGAAMRGSGVREKLAAEFAKRIAQQLSGTKSKPKAAS